MSIQLQKCLRCGHQWYPRRLELPKHCPKCNSPYWNRPKVKNSGPLWMTKGYDLGTGVTVLSKGTLKVENLSVDGPPRRIITGKPGMGKKSGQPSYAYIDIDRRDDNTTAVTHTVKEILENGEWVTVHQDKKQGKAKHRPKKKDEKP